MVDSIEGNRLSQTHHELYNHGFMKSKNRIDCSISEDRYGVITSKEQLNNADNDFRAESNDYTESTFMVTSSSSFASSCSYTRSKESGVFPDNRKKDDEAKISELLDSHFQNILKHRSKPGRNQKAYRDTFRGRSGIKSNLPPKSPFKTRSDSPIHLRLADCHTKSSSMRTKKGSMSKGNNRNRSNKQPFYNAVSSSPSVSSTTSFGEGSSYSTQRGKSRILRSNDSNEFYDSLAKSNSYCGNSIQSSSSVYSRLSVSQTKSYTMRLKEANEPFNKNRVQQKSNRPPFYTVVASSNSFSETSMSSMNKCAFNRPPVNKAARKASPGFHDQLAIRETYSSSKLRLPKQPIGFKRTTTNEKKPFYSTINNKHKIPPKTYYPPKAYRPPKATTSRRREYEAAGSYNSQPTKDTFCSTSISSILQKCYNHSKQNSSPTMAVPRNTIKTDRGRCCSNKKQSVYDRLASKDTYAYSQRNRRSLQYREEMKTFQEVAKNALMRDFKGSTHVSVSREHMSKSKIGFVFKCG